MGLVRGFTVAAPSLVVKKQASIFEQGDNVAPENRLLRVSSAWTAGTSNLGAPFTDMTASYVLVGSYTFTQRAQIHAAFASCSFDSAAGGYRLAVHVEIEGQWALSACAAGDNSGAGSSAVALGIIVQPGTLVRIFAQYRLTAAAFDLLAGVRYTPI